jgi:Endomembrane protein 70
MFTYSVTYKMSELSWAHRYEHYMKTQTDFIHYESLLYSTCLVLCFCYFAYSLIGRVIEADFIRRRLGR